MCFSKNILKEERKSLYVKSKKGKRRSLYVKYNKIILNNKTKIKKIGKGKKLIWLFTKKYGRYIYKTCTYAICFGNKNKGQNKN